MLMNLPDVPPTEVPLDRFTTLADGVDHPECVTAGPDGRVYAGGEAGQIYRLDPDGPSVLANTGGFVLGLCLDADSVIYACDQFRHEVVRVDHDGSVDSYSGWIKTANYPVFTAGGTLFVSDSGDWDENNGGLYRISRSGDFRRLDVDVAAFPNALAMSPAGDWLYVIESQLPGIVRIPIAPDDQPAGEPEIVAEMPGHVTDGVAVLADGDVLVSCYTPDVIYRIHEGEPHVLAYDPRRVVLAAPTSIAFHGAGHTHLAVGSLGRWHIASADIGRPGAPLNYPTMAGPQPAASR